MADNGYHSMDVQNIQRSSPALEQYNERPSFVNEEALRRKHSCNLCHDILVKPQQTPCGNRACNTCINERFRDETVIPCPMSHDDLEEDELAEEECQQYGLTRRSVTADHAEQSSLWKEKCHCQNIAFGCNEKFSWKKLREHEMNCAFRPQSCPNAGCAERFASTNLSQHLDKCEFRSTECPYCKTSFKQKNLEDHLSECNSAETQCKGCGRSFLRRKSLTIHQRIRPECLTSAGKCHYHEYCGFVTNSLEALQHHMLNSNTDHLEALTVRTSEMDLFLVKSRDTNPKEVKTAVNERVKPLERITAVLSMDMQKMKTELAQSETNGDCLVNAMKKVQSSSQQIDEVKLKVSVIERQIKDSGLDRVTEIESHSQGLRRLTELVTGLDKRMKHQELGSFDGSLVWKIEKYKQRKADAVRGQQMSIYSQPFYTSRHGYKMCCRIYLNGDGIGRGSSLSVFFVLMRGEYDQLLSFPFKQRVTFSLISPGNPALSKHETFLPDPDSSSFRKPQSEMNIASGCPQLASQSEVESSTFLVDDCLYISVQVASGGDSIQ